MNMSNNIPNLDPKTLEKYKNERHFRHIHVTPPDLTDKVNKALWWKNGNDLRERLDEEEDLIQEMSAFSDISSEYYLSIALEGASAMTAAAKDPDKMNGCEIRLMAWCGDELIADESHAGYLDPASFWGWHDFKDDRNGLPLHLFMIPDPVQFPECARIPHKHSLLCIVGRSGSGKTTIRNLLMEKYHLRPLVTYTTRQKRQDEVDGRDYHFISRIKAGRMNKVLATMIGEDEYFTNPEDIYNADMIIIEPEGIEELRRSFPDIQLFEAEVYVDAQERLERLKKRGDDVSAAEKRCADEDQRFNAFEKAEHPKYVNNDSEKTAEDIVIDFVGSIYEQPYNATNGTLTLSAVTLVTDTPYSEIPKDREALTRFVMDAEEKCNIVPFIIRKDTPDGRENLMRMVRNSHPVVEELGNGSCLIYDVNVLKTYFADADGKIVSATDYEW